MLGKFTTPDLSLLESFDGELLSDATVTFVSSLSNHVVVIIRNGLYSPMARYGHTHEASD
jgi:hypothetical protein